jgi:indolepyruvate ferredoxin oxidoreductase
VLNTYEAMPGPFTMKPDMQFPAEGIVAAVKTALDGRDPLLVDASELATALLGDSIATNLFMLGYAWQQAWCR